MTAYDSWLEKPYQDALAREDRYEDALEAEATSVLARLEALTVAALLEETDTFSATPYMILTQPAPKNGLAPNDYYNWSLSEVINAVALAEAKNNLETRADDDGDYGPDDLDDDFDGSRG